VLSSIKNFLTQPYPDEDHLKAILTDGVRTGLLISFILYFFRPFNMEGAQDLLSVSLMFGAITTGTSIIYDLVMTRLIGINRDHPRWTFIRWILYICGLMVFIAIANYVYMTVWLLNQPFYWLGLWYMLRGVLLIGVFPVTIFGALKMIKLLKKNQGIAASIEPLVAATPSKAQIALPTHNSTATWSVDPQHILYVEAQQNYVTITYVNDQYGISKEMIRNTLSNIADILSASSIIKCHRSYLVNKNRITDVSGNAQGLKLQLTGLEGATVPVSRKYIPLFR